MKGVSTDEIYRTRPPEQIPWNEEEPPALLVEGVRSGRIVPGKAIDLGCGLGHYSRYLAREGFDVTGVDLSPRAVELASERAKSEGLPIRFLAHDLVVDTSGLDRDFDFALEWYVLHHVEPADRPAYLAHVAEVLRPNGLYLSTCFSASDPAFGGAGDVRTTPIGTVLYFSTEAEIEKLTAPHFRVVELAIREITGSRGTHRAVCGLFAKR